MPTYLNAHAKLNKWIYDIQYPGNRFESDIILNDFWSCSIWEIQIQVSLTEFKNPKNSGIPTFYKTGDQFVVIIPDWSWFSWGARALRLDIDADVIPPAGCRCLFTGQSWYGPVGIIWTLLGLLGRSKQDSLDLSLGLVPGFWVDQK